MHYVARRASAVITVAVLATAALAVPMLLMAPEEFASQEPGGRIFEARDAIDERFGGDVVGWFFVVEAVDGEMLDRDSLNALAERVDTLRSHPEQGPLLVPRIDPATGEEVAGALSLVDTVDVLLARAGAGSLATADEAAVRTVLGEIVDVHGPGTVGLSTQASRDPDRGWWTAPAVTMSILADGARMEGRGADAGFGADVAVEQAGREVLAMLRDTDALTVWAIALDQSLTAGEQGEAAGPFIGFTVLAIVLLVGLAFRSYWTLAVVGAALTALLVWLQGLANLVGLKEDQILSTVVPIAMIAFGVDYAFHAVGRYREERAGLPPRPAVERALVGVAPALALAFATGAFAFLANTASGIESIVQFGIAAALALAAAFFMLGVVVPLALTLVDEQVEGLTWRWSRPAAVGGGVVASSTAMLAVLLVVFLSPPAGLAVLAGYILVFVLLPLWAAGRFFTRANPLQDAEALGQGRLARWLGALVAGVAGRRAIVLPAVGVLTAFAAVGAVQVPVSFDVEDFFSPETDFVMALDKLDEHVGAQGGEPADVYVSADLDDPEAVAAVGRFADRVAALDTPLLAADDDGRVRVDRRALGVLEGDAVLTPAERDQVVAPANGDGLEAARLGVGLVGSRAQENVERVRDQLEPLVADLDAELTALHPDAEATLTGTPIVRVASLDAISRSLRISVPMAVLLCFLCAWAFMRSFRYAAVSMVPILLVVAWLYGFMYVAGYSINLVTATIGAISIGVGIDFATHMTMRFREELERAATRIEALRATTAGTGVALVGSTLSSVAGFAILAFAPMPMFASYGLLTAVMISLALVASLLVLPGLLMLVTADPDPGEGSLAERPPAEGLAPVGGVPA